MGQKRPKVFANETLYQLSYDPVPTAAHYGNHPRPGKPLLHSTARWSEVGSIHQHQHGGLLHGLDHVLELAGLGGGFLEAGGDFGDGFEEAQEVAALDGVVHAPQRGAGIQPRVGAAQRSLPWGSLTNAVVP